MTIVEASAKKPAEPVQSRPKSAPLLCSQRLNIFILLMLGTTLFMLLRANINFALVCMVKSPHNNLTTFVNGSSDAIPAAYDSAVDYRCALDASSRNSSGDYVEAEFDWSKDVQAGILGSFSYGFILTQVLGGWMSERFGGKTLFLSTSLVFSILTVLNPMMAKLGPAYLFVNRLLLGFVHGTALPCINVFSVRWSDPSERGFLVGIAYSGLAVGAAITYPLCALICQTLGWESIFYITGGLGALWSILSYFVMFDWPEHDPRISEQELQFLQANRSQTLDIKMSGKKRQVPWRKIITSVPVNALNVTHFCTLWAFTTLSMFLPAYMNEVLRMDIRSNGILSSLPYVGMLICHLGVGKLFDWVRSKKICTLTTQRKVFNTIGTVFPCIGLVAVMMLSCNDMAFAITVVSVSQALSEFAFMGGYLLSVMEMAPAYAGLLTGVMNLFGVLPGFLGPIAVSFLTVNSTRDEWLNVFYLAAIIHLFGGIVYLIFGSGEVQKWAAVPKRSVKEDPESGQKLLTLSTNGKPVTDQEADQTDLKISENDL